jgi:hypothetical protein
VPRHDAAQGHLVVFDRRTTVGTGIYPVTHRHLVEGKVGSIDRTVYCDLGIRHYLEAVPKH